jgi:hypothetical protein
MPVLDASCAIELVLDGDAKAAVLAALRGEIPEAPEILQLEALQTLRGLVRGGKVPLTRANGAVRRLGTLRLSSYRQPSALARLGPARPLLRLQRSLRRARRAAQHAAGHRGRRLARRVESLVRVVVVDC